MCFRTGCPIHIPGKAGTSEATDIAPRAKFNHMESLGIPILLVM